MDEDGESETYDPWSMVHLVLEHGTDPGNPPHSAPVTVVSLRPLTTWPRGPRASAPPATRRAGRRPDA